MSHFPFLILLHFGFSTPGSASDGPYLSLSNFTLNGRSDESMSPTEQVVVGFTVGNVGDLDSQGGTIEIAQVDGPVTVKKKAIKIGALAVGGRVDLAGDQSLAIVVSPDSSGAAVVTLHLKWTTQEGGSGILTRGFRVIRGELAVVSTDFGDVATPDSGGIVPGGSGKIFVTLSNTGTETVQDAKVTWKANACVTAVAGDTAIPDLAPGQQIRIAAPLTVSVSSACGNGSAVKVDLDGTYKSRIAVVPVKSQATFYAGLIGYREKELTANPKVVIPSEGPATAVVELPLAVDFKGVVKDLAVTVRLTHNYCDDLMVWLRAPDGTEVLLHNRLGGQNLNKTYGMGGEAVAELGQFKDKPVEGTWKVRVQDVYQPDGGTLDYAKIRFKGYLSNSTP